VRMVSSFEQLDVGSSWLSFSNRVVFSLLVVDKERPPRLFLIESISIFEFD